MKTASVKNAPRRTSAASSMTNVIVSSLREARRDAVKTASMHHTSIIYLRDGKIITDRPTNPKSRPISGEQNHRHPNRINH